MKLNGLYFKNKKTKDTIKLQNYENQHKGIIVDILTAIFAGIKKA